MKKKLHKSKGKWVVLVCGMMAIGFTLTVITEAQAIDTQETAVAVLDTNATHLNDAVPTSVALPGEIPASTIEAATPVTEAPQAHPTAETASTAEAPQAHPTAETASTTASPQTSNSTTTATTNDTTPTSELVRTTNQAEEMVDVNILAGKKPTTNSTQSIAGDLSTEPSVLIKHPDAATDGDKSSATDDNRNTKIIAGVENGQAANHDNGFSEWRPVYLQYDFGKQYAVKEINLYRNQYEHAISRFHDVKVELSNTADFSDNVYVAFPHGIYAETEATKGQPQRILLSTPIDARYLRVWGRGHYITNLNSSWAGYSNGVLFNEIEVIASVPRSIIPEPDQDKPVYNLAPLKLPYIYGQEMSNITALNDQQYDQNYAVYPHGQSHWLQYEYKNSYNIYGFELKLESATYKNIKVELSNNPKAGFSTIFSANNFIQTDAPLVFRLQKSKKASVVRFTVSRQDNQPTKYSEIVILGNSDTDNYDESMPEYRPPVSQYQKLVWSDEFNGEVIDETKWQIIDGMVNHGAIYNRGAVKIVQDGEHRYLSINTHNYETTDRLIQHVGINRYPNKQIPSHVTWSSGRLESKDKYSFQHGRVAVRAKVNDSQGIWPAIWMLAQDETGHDEIDILEYLGQTPWDAWTTNHFGILGKNKESHGGPTVHYEAWSQQFHIFETEWRPDKILFYIDGIKVFETNRGRKNKDSMHSRPMFPILETQVGDGWVGPVDYTKRKTKQDSNYLIDWIRIYQDDQSDIVKFDNLKATPDTGDYYMLN